MPPDARDFSHRAQLTELIDGPCSRDQLRACLRDVARLNRWFLGYRPTLQWLESLILGAESRPIHILDVGCGYGDGLRRIERWAHTRGIAVELTGIDINPDAIAIAAEASDLAANPAPSAPQEILLRTTAKTAPETVALLERFWHRLGFSPRFEPEQLSS